MKFMVESNNHIYIVCENADESIELRNDELRDAGIYCITDPSYENWVLKIIRADLSNENYKDLYNILDI